MAPEPNILAGRYNEVRAGGYTSGTQVFPPPAAAFLTASRTMAGLVGAELAASATFDVTYHDFSDDAKKAFQAAVDVWSVLISTPVTIKVDAHWTALGPGVLGSAGAKSFRRDFPSAPSAKTWYPIALANKISGSDLEPGEADIRANFNKNFDNWYFGTDGQTPFDRYDLMSVVLHELGHGLGFAGSMDVDGVLGSWGLGTAFPIIYDRFVENLSGESLIDVELFPNNSAELAGQLTSERLVFDGPKARAANAGSPPRLFAPITWDPGSSFSHFNETTFSAGSSNSLMTPQIGMGESIHSPGPIALGLMSDIGW